jgi:integrase
LRQGELFALTWNDIDFKNMAIKVNKSYKDVKDIESGEYVGVIQTPKTDKGFRSVPMPDHLKPVLDQHRTKQKIIKIKLGALYQDNNLVFSNNLGKYLDSSNN